MDGVTQILFEIESGNPQAAEQLLPLVYDGLRKLATAKLAIEKPGQTLQPTALVHEAYLRLVDQDQIQQWQSHGHFFAAAAEAMRRILIEQARRKARGKHGGGRHRVELNDPEAREYNDELIALDAVLPELEKEDRLAADIVKLKFFAGLGRDKIAASLGITVHEVRQRWSYARAWLRLALEE